MFPVGFETTIPAGTRPQTCALYRAAIGIGCLNCSMHVLLIAVVDLTIFTNRSAIHFMFRNSAILIAVISSLLKPLYFSVYVKYEIFLMKHFSLFQYRFYTLVRSDFYIDIITGSSNCSRLFGVVITTWRAREVVNR
jgi:hypothetical protein